MSATKEKVEYVPAYVLIEAHLPDLEIDDRYQRPVTKFVNRIAKNFQPALCQPLAISDRGPKGITVIDGQHRLVAMLKLGIEDWPAMLYSGMTPEEEAKLFAEFQRERKPLRPWDRYRAELFSGDPKAKAIDEIVTKAGFVIEPMVHQNSITAVVSLERIYDLGGPPLLRNTLNAVRNSWFDSGRQGREGRVLRGIALFITKQKDLDLDRLEGALTTTTPQDVKRRASALMEGHGHGGHSDRFIAQVLADVYRSHRG